MRPRIIAIWGALLLMAALVACGSSAGNAEAGRQLFLGETLPPDSTLPTCISCHPVNAGEPGDIGTNLSNIGNRAATTVPGQAAEDYLRTAILDPDAYLAGGFQEGIHYRDYREALTDQQVNDLIAYLLTLKSGQD